MSWRIAVEETPPGQYPNQLTVFSATHSMRQAATTRIIATELSTAVFTMPPESGDTVYPKRAANREPRRGSPAVIVSGVRRGFDACWPLQSAAHRPRARRNRIGDDQRTLLVINGGRALAAGDPVSGERLRSDPIYPASDSLGARGSRPELVGRAAAVSRIVRPGPGRARDWSG